MKNKKHKTKNDYNHWSFYVRRWSFRNGSGYAALTAVLLTMVVSLIVAGGFTFFTFQEINVNRVFTSSIESRYIAEGGIEDAAYRVVSGKQIGGSETLGVGSGTTTISVTTIGNQRIIRSEGKRENIQQNTEARIDVTVAPVGFTYGAQVGDLGLTMDPNATVDGSVYSGGDIIGSSGATIIGDAFAAAGISPSVNQSWETQNTDVPVGRVTGSIITAVDQPGVVGKYNSLAIGSDGFTRISYYDETNGDLKFAQCLDHNCMSRATTTIDAAGDVGWRYTSLKIGSDGLVRISYYDASNKDLKFARCLNDNCTSKNITVVESAGDVGQFSSLALGSDGFARISYYKATGGDLKFARCLDADCSSKNITTVDSSGDVGSYTSLVFGADGFARISYRHEGSQSLKFARCTNADCTAVTTTTVDASVNAGDLRTAIALGSDGFVRISYLDDTNDDLRLARCTNPDCTTRVVTTVDATGNVGKYNSMVMHPDGFPRASYYGAGDLRYTRCTNTDCTTKVTNDPDNTSADLGHYTSITVGADGFARMAHYDNTNGDLRYVRCTDADCTPPDPDVDVAQGFQPSVSDRANRVDLFIKRVGNPADATIRIIRSSNGSPSTNPDDVLATGPLPANSVATSYSWVPAYLTSAPTLNAGTTYWIVIDASQDNANYFLWGGDSSAGYTAGLAKRTADWTQGGWQSRSEDLAFRVSMGGVDRKIADVTINGNAHAHVIENTGLRTIGGDASGFTLRNVTVSGNVNTNAISDCIVSGTAAYNSVSNCTIVGAQTTPNTPPPDPPQIPLPIASSTIQQWKNEAAIGGTCAPPDCEDDGDYDPSGCAISLGPKKIAGDMKLDAPCSGGQTLTVTGTIWVAGNIEISNNAKILLASGYGTQSGVVLSDGWIHLSNNGQFAGSGTVGSYLMLLSLASGGGHHGSAIDLHNNATGAIFYAANGLVWLHNNVTVIELVGRGVHLDNNAILIYEQGLANVKFTAGPTGGYDVKYWKEVE